MWFLQARCDLLFSIINHKSNSVAHMQNETEAVAIENVERHESFIVSTHIDSFTLTFHEATEDRIAGYGIQ